jgi:hypothetical protein
VELTKKQDGMDVCSRLKIADLALDDFFEVVHYAVRTLHDQPRDSNTLLEAFA